MQQNLTTITLIIGMIIFASTVLWHVEVWASKSKAEMKLMSANLDWEGHLYKQTVQKIREDK